MSREEFDDDCSDCRPAVLDTKTGKLLPSEDPIMAAVNEVWDSATPEERKAFHKVTCQNSRHPDDLDPATELVRRIQSAAAKTLN